MSVEITTAFVQQYSANVFHLSQQKGSRLRRTVRQESQVGKSAFYDRIGSVAAIRRTGRHEDTPQLDTPHSRRRVTLNDYVWADLVDNEDKIRMLNDPTSEYAMAAMWAMGRAMDDEVISALGGNAYAGEDGSTTVALPTAQKYHANTGSALSNLNVLTLRAAKMTLDQAEVDPSIKRYFVCSASQINALLGQTEVTSSDYNSIKALVQGDVNTFMGFEFIRIERLSTGSGSASATTGAVGSGTAYTSSRLCYAYAGDAALLAIGQDMTGRISEREDKNYATQVYARMTIGATRMEDVKVVQVLCKES
jgi:hypothetical protein